MAHLVDARILIAVVAVIACSSTLVLSAQQMTQSESDATSQANGLPSIFDYKHYQELFHKQYSSHLEEVTRKVYFYARAFAAYASALAYRVRKSSTYQALNRMSDWSQLELDQMKNKALAGPEEATSKEPAGGKEVDSQDSAETAEKLAQQLEEAIGEKLKETNSEHALDENRDGAIETGSKRLRRQKRALGKRTRRGPRKISMDMLVRGAESTPEPASAMAKAVRKPESNNPKYDELALELDTMGLVDQQTKVKFWELKPKPPSAKSTLDEEMDADQPKSRLDGLKNLLLEFSWSWLDFYQEDETDELAEDDEQPADEMFSDLRTSGCMWRPRHQGKCGSCYAFAGVSMAEFMFCSATNRLYSFSEQYLVDCGKGLIGGMLGCGGAHLDSVAQFVHNFGLELRDRYPYADREGLCPYSKSTDLESTGFIRMDLHDALFVPVDRWPEVLKRSPILVAIATTPDFDFYGGGVDSGEKCIKQADHAMLVVGHGREDGQEFWLIRNSYGTDWGVDGYYKLAKSAPKRCIENQEGMVWATRNGVNFRLEPKLNKANVGLRQEAASGRRPRAEKLPRAS